MFRIGDSRWGRTKIPNASQGYWHFFRVESHFNDV
jgi:hypothetical protein